MGRSIQVAFQLPDQDLAELDRLVPGEFPTRAAALRHAVSEWLDQRREEAIDAQLERAYAASPQGEEEAAWAAEGLEALKEADLDW